MINRFDWQACGAAALSSWSSVLLCPSLVLLYLRCDHIVMLMMTRVFIFEMCSDEKHFSRLMPGAGLVAAQIQSRFSIWENDAASYIWSFVDCGWAHSKQCWQRYWDTKIWQGTMPSWHHHHEYLKLWFWLILFVVWQNLASHCQSSSMQPQRRDSEKLLDKSKTQVLSSSSLSSTSHGDVVTIIIIIMIWIKIKIRANTDSRGGGGKPCYNKQGEGLKIKLSPPPSTKGQPNKLLEISWLGTVQVQVLGQPSTTSSLFPPRFFIIIQI